MTTPTAEDFTRMAAQLDAMPWSECWRLKDQITAYLRHAATLAAPLDAPGLAELRVVFDALPSPVGSRLIECEDARGHGVNAGEWRARPDGLCELVIRTLPRVVP